MRFICSKCQSREILASDLTSCYGKCEFCGTVFVWGSKVEFFDTFNRLRNINLKKNNMKEERTLKISLEQARKIWKERSSEYHTSVALNSIHGILLETFTKEELEGSEGYSWEDSFEPGYQLNSTGLNRVVVRKCVNKTAQDHFKDQFRTEKQALSALAFAQLSHIVAHANNKSGPPEYDHLGEMIIYSISLYSNFRMLIVSRNTGDAYQSIQAFYFNKREDAENSLKFNKELWEQYYAGFGL